MIDQYDKNSMTIKLLNFIRMWKSHSMWNFLKVKKLTRNTKPCLPWIMTVVAKKSTRRRLNLPPLLSCIRQSFIDYLYSFRQNRFEYEIASKTATLAQNIP